jgi:hypothetical protein
VVVVGGGWCRLRRVVGEAVEEARRRQADDNEDGAEGEEAMRWRSGGGGGSSARGTRPRLCFRFFFALAGEFGGWTEGGGEKEGRKRVCCVSGWTGRRRGERKLNGAGRCCRVPGRVEINWHEDFYHRFNRRVFRIREPVANSLQTKSQGSFNLYSLRLEI